MEEQQQRPAHPQASAMGRAAIGLAGVGGTVAGALGSFNKLQQVARDFAVSADGTRTMLTSITLYQAVWMVFFLAMLAAGISLMIAAIRGRSSDIVPGPSIYVMGTTLVIAGMFQLLFGEFERAAVTGLVGMVLMVAEYRSALL